MNNSNSESSANAKCNRVAPAPHPWLWRNGPYIALAVLVLINVGLLLVLTSGLTYYQDTWEFLMNRRSFTVDSLLKPHNEHIVLIPVMLQQLQLTIFGMTSATPEYVFTTVMLAISAVLLFVYVRKRTAPWLAVVFAALLLFIGPAWETLLWPFEICFIGSMLFGIAMLLALEREDRCGDIAATFFLAISLGFNSLGLAFAVAATVDILQHRHLRFLRRVYLVAIPLMLYGAWYIGWAMWLGMIYRSTMFLTRRDMYLKV